MKKTDETILQEMKEARNYSESTVRNYRSAIKKYVSYFGMSLEDLISEAEEEEKQKVRWKDRKLKKRLMEYRQYLLDNFLLSTARYQFILVRSVYKYFEIEMFPLPYTSYKAAHLKAPLTYADLPTKEIISDAVQLSTPLLKAIILFISSSGTGRTETLSLKIEDFIESVQDYTYETDIYKIIRNLHQRNDIIPMFKLKRKKINQYYYTFCSPEATSAIMDYLLTRKQNLKPEDPLFKVNMKYLSALLGDLNDQLGLGKKSGFNRLRCHMLRKYHATQLSNEINSLTETDIDFLQGRSDSKTRQSYFFTDEKKLKRRYAESMNAVTIYNEYNVLVDSNNDLFIEVHDPHDDIVPLQEQVVQLGKENSLLRSENKEIRDSVKAEAKKVFMELLRENNIEL